MIDTLIDDDYKPETETEEFISKLEAERPTRNNGKSMSNMATHGDPPIHRDGLGNGNSTQWTVQPDGAFSPCSETVDHLPSAVYRLNCDQFGVPIFIKIDLITDDLVSLPDSASARVLDGIQRFWESGEKFRRFGQIFKRGILLWGPPGSGKTALIIQLIADLVRRDGTVVIAAEPALTARALAQFRRIEPSRKLICILEDIDELTRRYGEAELLALLDGESQIDSVVYLASTNYPEELDARLVNRPSRFDDVIKISMPSAAARMAYLRSRFKADDLPDLNLQAWVDDTEGFSIAHLREMVVGIFCLGRGYEETLKRLKGMQRTPKSMDGKVISLAPVNRKSEIEF